MGRSAADDVATYSQTSSLRCSTEDSIGTSMDYRDGRLKEKEIGSNRLAAYANRDRCNMEDSPWLAAGSRLDLDQCMRTQGSTLVT
jgi:hypothetical protein